jgi:hypothetical protein
MIAADALESTWDGRCGRIAVDSAPPSIDRFPVSSKDGAIHEGEDAVARSALTVD